MTSCLQTVCDILIEQNTVCCFPNQMIQEVWQSGETSVISNFQHASLILDKIRVMNLPQETSNTTTAETRMEAASPPNGVLFNSFAVRNKRSGLFVFDHRIVNTNADHNAYFNQRIGIWEFNFLQVQTGSLVYSFFNGWRVGFCFVFVSSRVNECTQMQSSLSRL